MCNDNLCSDYTRETLVAVSCYKVGFFFVVFPLNFCRLSTFSPNHTLGERDVSLITRARVLTNHL